VNRILLLGVAGSALFLLPGDCADAGCRHVQVVQQLQAAVQYQPVYAQPYLYSVGANLQTQASEERIAALVIQKLNAQQLTTSANNSQTSHNLPAPQTLPLTAEVDRWQLVRNRCAGCHETNAKAKEAISFSGELESLTCEQRLNAIRQLVDGSMPKGKPVTAEELGDLIGTFSGSEKVGK
jgi:hypothetical protein